jgi:hypothetical protein
MDLERYNARVAEPKWQGIWEEKEIFRTRNDGRGCVRTRPSDRPFQIFGEFWPILSDRRLADRAKPLWTSPFRQNPSFHKVWTHSGPSPNLVGALMNGSKRSSAMLQYRRPENRRRHLNRWGRRCHACPLKNSYLFRLAATVSELDGSRRNRSSMASLPT